MILRMCLELQGNRGCVREGSAQSPPLFMLFYYAVDFLNVVPESPMSVLDSHINLFNEK